MSVVAFDLLEAASLSATNLGPLWVADTMKTKMIAFAAALYSEFPESAKNNAPIANWLAVIGAFAPTIQDFVQDTQGLTTAGVNTIATFESSCDYVYRICKFAYYYTLITSDQKDAILAAYNAQFT
jgi:hypothetical protein